MNVLLLSDFSKVAINATHYAMDLLQDQHVNFYLLNIFDPDSDFVSQDAEARKATTMAIMQDRVQKLQERSGNRSHKVTGHYSGDKLVNAARDFVKKQNIDLIVMGSVGQKQRYLTILGKHTFEIMSKIKCNILAIPDDYVYRNLESMLLPLDYSASFQRNNLQFLINQKIFYKTKLSVWKIEDLSTIQGEESLLNKKIFSDINGIKVDFFTFDRTAISDKSTWNDVQKQFQLIILMGKNVRICHVLMNNRQGLFKSIPNRLPILVLHD